MSSTNNTPPSFDSVNFDTSPTSRRIEKPWGYELHWVPDSAPYMGKILHINAGARLSLQLHDNKQESWLILKGRAMVVWQDSQGQMIETELTPDQGYSTQLGQKHRLVGITDCDILEVSTPELGTTWRLEDDYARPNETPSQRRKERQ